METKAVKSALLKAGIDVLNVEHGNGTAWGWLHLTLARPLEEGCEEHGSHGGEEGFSRNTCLQCQRWLTITSDLCKNALVVAQQVTGRHGDYDGRINTHLQ